ncbi:hypothetical protein PIB30_093139, partial [Stylosanthes scabra]|nr:hypothetical protein [Stylosanthes scabra]
GRTPLTAEAGRRRKHSLRLGDARRKATAKGAKAQPEARRRQKKSDGERKGNTAEAQPKQRGKLGDDFSWPTRKRKEAWLRRMHTAESGRRGRKMKHTAPTKMAATPRNGA